MGERKGVNKYYPPDFDPGKGGLNKYHGTHALRERARKLHEGILIIRFEMPYNIWCNGCGNHIGMGVRYNAQKKKVGNYYTTPIYKFRMKCHLCDQHFEIQTDPKNCDYVILSGARRKEERWDPAVTENIQTTDRDVKAKLVSDAMYKLEHSIMDKQKAKKSAPTLGKLRNIRDVWQDDYAVNQVLRQKFRKEKKEIVDKNLLESELKEKALLPSTFPLLDEDPEDAELAKRIKYGDDNVRPDLKRKMRSQEIKRSSIFENRIDSKGKLVRRIVGLGKCNKDIPKNSTSENHMNDTKKPAVILKRTVPEEIKNDTEDSTSEGRGNNDMDIQKSPNVNALNSSPSIAEEENAIFSTKSDAEFVEHEFSSSANSSVIVAYSSSSEGSD